MSLDASLATVLACPVCKGPLMARPEELHCETCRLAYPIREDVPELLTEEARPLPPSAR
jgi:uncharacterized protein